MAEVKCVSCQTRACTDEVEKTPNFCPRRITAEALEKAEAIRATDSEVMKIVQVFTNLQLSSYLERRCDAAFGLLAVT